MTTRTFNYKGYRVGIRFVEEKEQREPAIGTAKTAYVAVGVYDDTRTHFLTEVHYHSVNESFFAERVNDAICYAVAFIDEGMKHYKQTFQSNDAIVKAVNKEFDNCVKEYANA